MRVLPYLIALILTLLTCSTSSALELLVKVGSKYPSQLSANHGKGWRDGEIIDIRESGFYTGQMIRKHHCVIDFPNIDYWTLRGSTDWKSTKASVMNLKKFLCKADSTSKYRWETGFSKISVLESRRDFFIDFQDLKDKGLITKAQYDSIYDKTKDHLPITFTDLSFSGKLKNGKTDTRLNEK